MYDLSPRDWKSLAQANGLSAKELDGVARPLEALEKVFRPLLRGLPYGLEPALEFRAEADAE
jgi:hypothetical protein